MLDAFISGWISSKGPYVKKFEEDFSRFVGVRHGVAVSNGTVALHLALVALGIGPGDEVIVPDLTFAATINAVLYCGATPVIVDVDRRDLVHVPRSVKHACTAQTKAIIPVHLYGRPAEIGPIAEFARGRGIAVVEDALKRTARATRPAVGQFGDVSCFSFYANKIVTTGEGGMCLTDSLSSRLVRVLRDHGMSPDRSYWHERVGFNYRITNLQAAIGQSQLWRIDETLPRNGRVAALYREALKGIPDVPSPQIDRIRARRVACLRPGAGPQASAIMGGAEDKIEIRPFSIRCPRCRPTGVRPQPAQQRGSSRPPALICRHRATVDLQIVERFVGCSAMCSPDGKDENRSHPSSSVVVPGGLGPSCGPPNMACSPPGSTGVAIVERQGRLGGTLGRYGSSNRLAAPSSNASKPRACRTSFHPLRDSRRVEMARTVRAFRRCASSTATCAESARPGIDARREPASACIFHRCAVGPSAPRRHRRRLAIGPDGTRTVDRPLGRHRARRPPAWPEKAPVAGSDACRLPMRHVISSECGC